MLPRRRHCGWSALSVCKAHSRGLQRVKYGEDHWPSVFIERTDAVMSDLEKKLRDLVAKIARADACSVGMDDDVMATLGLDSLAALRMLATVEKQFGIRFPDDRLAQMRTLRQILAELENKGERAT